MDLPDPLSPVMPTKVFSSTFRFMSASALPSPYEYERPSQTISTSSASTVSVPWLRSGRLSSENIWSSTGAAPMAVWKYDPKMRMGRKNSTASNATEMAAGSEMLPAASWNSAITIPTAAPPNVKKSITVMEFSCMRRRRMVEARKPSASSSICCCLASSAWNSFSVVRALMDS